MDHEAHDSGLIAAINERTVHILDHLKAIDRRAEKQESRMDSIETRILNFPCVERETRLSRLEKIVYSACAVVFSAVVFKIGVAWFGKN